MEYKVTKNKTYTKGGVIVEEIKVGDIQYEYGYGACIKVEVLTLPVCDDDGLWTWESKSVRNGGTIPYAVHKKYSHYGPNLYDHEAYKNVKMV